MNTYHISPTSPLAAYAADEVRAFDADALVAIRGQVFHYGNGEVEEIVYTISTCPQDDTSGYCWTYVRAGDWIAEFDAIQQGA